MPREKITWNDGPFQLHVGWNKEAEYVEATMRASDDTDNVFAAQQLTRSQINTAIRVLRTARDAVYGRDE